MRSAEVNLTKSEKKSKETKLLAEDTDVLTDESPSSHLDLFRISSHFNYGKTSNAPSTIRSRLSQRLLMKVMLYCANLDVADETNMDRFRLEAIISVNECERFIDSIVLSASK